MGRSTIRSGRHRRALDALARELRRHDPDQVVEALIVQCRGHADLADQVEHDPAESAYTVSRVLTEYAARLDRLGQFLPSTLTHDPLADALAAAVRDSAQA